MSGIWDEGLFHCYGDCKLCILQYFCPCLVFGYVGEAAGDDKKKVCISFFVPFLQLYTLYNLRKKIKEQKRIEESKALSIMLTIFCSFCSLNQLARETGSGPYGQNMARE